MPLFTSSPAPSPAPFPAWSPVPAALARAYLAHLAAVLVVALTAVLALIVATSVPQAHAAGDAMPIRPRPVDDDVETDADLHRPLDLIILKHDGGDQRPVLVDARSVLDSWRQVTPLPVVEEPTVFSAASLAGSVRAVDAPAWVLMSGDLEFTADADLVSALKLYLGTGGNLFADARSPAWAASFRQLAAKLYPDTPLTPIPATDPIFNQPADLHATPYVAVGASSPEAQPGAPETTPSLFGIRQGTRWPVVCYESGLSRAWTPGSQAINWSAAARLRAQLLGLNLAFYFERRSALEIRLSRIAGPPDPAARGKPDGHVVPPGATADGTQVTPGGEPEPDFSDLPIPE